MFLFKKIVSAFLMPLPLSLIFCLYGLILLWFTKKQWVGKISVTLGIVCFVLLSFEPVSNVFLAGLESRYETYVPEPLEEKESGIDFIVVLSGGHVADPNLPLTSQLNGASLVRLVESIRLYFKHPGSKLILSGGGFSNSVPEAKLMADLALDLGVPKEDIIQEPESKDTKDQARLIRELVGDKKFLLVTSASHMPRSMALFNKLEMDPVAAPTNHLVRGDGEKAFYQLFPGSSDLRKTEKAFHEYLGMAWAGLMGQI